MTKVVNKIVGLPVLKDHGSAGVTGALKNMSHGSVNNVARSHSNTFTNVCNQFIPQVVSHPIIRQKFVLQIMDGIRGVYQGGPFSGTTGKWTWEYNATPLATDPVALDHVEWDIIDAQRIEKKLPPSVQRASSQATRSNAKDLISASPSTLPWPAHWDWATSTRRHRAAGGTRSST